MRTFATALVLGIFFMTGCSHSASMMPQPHSGNRGDQIRSGAPTAGPPTHYAVLYRFQGGADGSRPLGGVVRDAAGNLYGTTERGGGSTGCPGGCGVVFKVDPSGHKFVLHAFTGPPDGKLPMAGLMLDAAGNLYGTTSSGGPKPDSGTVFKVDASGNETVVHGFFPGAYLTAGLIMDATGTLYGTAQGGGNGYGSVFKIDASGNYTNLFSFDVKDGFRPDARLARDSAGNLYGTTIDDQSNLCDTGCGEVFELDINGNETILHSFTGGDGEHPNAGVVRDSAGNIYGTTRAGGPGGGCATQNGCGVMFKLDQLGNETILIPFKGKSGENPLGDLVRDSDGNFYGTTSRGGALGFGTVFKLDTNGNETVLHSFNSSDGGPDGGVVRDANGNLYGTAQYPTGNGVVFKITH
jgi:uncharacterized repeat protein (TIGR03803 family)